MKTYFAQLLSLLPSIAQGDHVNLRGASLQVEPESVRQLDGIPSCIPSTAVYAWFPNAEIGCASNSQCGYGNKCLVGVTWTVLFCGVQGDNQGSVPLC
jgi:hypothetical protein